MPGIFNNLLCCRNNHAVDYRAYQAPQMHQPAQHQPIVVAATLPPPPEPLQALAPALQPALPPHPQHAGDRTEHDSDFLLRRAEDALKDALTTMASSHAASHLPTGSFYRLATRSAAERIADARPALKTLTARLSDAHTTQLEKIEVCKKLIMQMTTFEEVGFNNAPRPVEFFASYGIDIALTEIGQQYTARLDDDFHHLLGQWSKTLCPTQTEFNLNGVVYTKAEVEQILQDRNLFQRQGSAQPNEAIANEMEMTMQTGAGSQSVHSNVAYYASTQNYHQMMHRIREAGLPIDTDQTRHELSNFITSELKGLARSDARAGLNRVYALNGTDSLWAIQVTPGELLSTVWAYIKTTEGSAELSTALKMSLANRLVEIRREGPCMVGVLQRIIDTPSGIDLDMNAFAAAQNMQNDLTHLAATVNERFSTLVDEDAEARQALGDAVHEDDTVSELGRTLLNQRAELELHVARGLNPNEYAPQLRQLEEGF